MNISGAVGTGLAQPDIKPNSSQGAGQGSIGEQLNNMAGVSTTKSLAGPAKTMDKDAFLRMFMEQLKYQDPMNPVKNEQFTQQMATFSQLEQALQTNKNLEKMIAQQSNTQVAALQLVGKTINADRSSLYHEKGKWTGMSFKIPNEMSDINIEIVDPNGEIAKTYKIGDRNPGDVSWKWDGLLESGHPAESGRYSYRVKGKDSEQKEISIDSKIDGKVSGVTSSQGVVYLLVGDQKIALNDVITIKDGSASDGAINSGGKAAIFNPNASALPSGIAPRANDGSTAGLEESENSQEAEQVASNSAGTKTVSNNKERNGRNQDRDDASIASSQNWDRMNPLMPLNLR